VWNGMFSFHLRDHMQCLLITMLKTREAPWVETVLKQHILHVGNLWEMEPGFESHFTDPVPYSAPSTLFMDSLWKSRRHTPSEQSTLRCTACSTLAVFHLILATALNLPLLSLLCNCGNWGTEHLRCFVCWISNVI
jgi:hypothetical protein